ncbi:MAG: hypothetical protein DHS20C06_09870 [Hyphobacterium sp.]|nr:MAG: hypothetical protein DHS20C06_09870 [Hyphobacterium sp.]
MIAFAMNPSRNSGIGVNIAGAKLGTGVRAISMHGVNPFRKAREFDRRDMAEKPVCCQESECF